jgi:hypothetical protein
MTTPSPTNILVAGDLTTTLVAGIWASSFNIPKPAEHAAKAFAISVISRVISQNSGMVPLVNADQKNEIIVGLFGMLSAYMSKTNLVRGGLTQISEDLIGDWLVRTFKQEPNYSFYDFPAAGAANPLS